MKNIPAKERSCKCKMLDLELSLFERKASQVILLIQP